MKKKKILFLSQCFPLPADGGGKIKTWNTLQTLSQKYEVFAVFVSERKPQNTNAEQLQKLGIHYQVFTTTIMMENIKNNYPKLLWNYCHLRPHYVYQYRYLPAFKFIQQKIKSWQPDCIHVDHINSSQFLPSENWFKKNLHYRPFLILENHNLDHFLFFTRFAETQKLIRKIYLFIEGCLNWWYGQRNYPRYDIIWSISPIETKYLRQHFPHKTILDQPLVYPLSAVKPSYRKKYDILFIGHLEWPPNEVALQWFCQKIFPLIQKKIPSVQFYAIGKQNPHLDFLVQNPAIHFLGYQENIDPFLAQAKTFVLPFKTGAGIRIKALTALQNGIPLVSTSLGVAGLAVKNKETVLLANSANKFAQQVVILLQNQQLQLTMSQKEKSYFLSNHSLKQNQRYLAIYESYV